MLTTEQTNAIDILEVWGSDLKQDAGIQEIMAAIDEWREAGRTPEIAYCGWGKVGNGVGHYAILGSRLNDGILDGLKFVFTGFTLEATKQFAEVHEVKLYE